MASKSSRIPDSEVPVQSVERGDTAEAEHLAAGSEAEEYKPPKITLTDDEEKELIQYVGEYQKVRDTRRAQGQPSTTPEPPARGLFASLYNSDFIADAQTRSRGIFGYIEQRNRPLAEKAVGYLAFGVLSDDEDQEEEMANNKAAAGKAAGANAPKTQSQKKSKAGAGSTEKADAGQPANTLARTPKSKAKPPVRPRTATPAATNPPDEAASGKDSDVEEVEPVYTFLHCKHIAEALRKFNSIEGICVWQEGLDSGDQATIKLINDMKGDPILSSPYVPSEYINLKPTQERDLIIWNEPAVQTTGLPGPPDTWNTSPITSTKCLNWSIENLFAPVDTPEPPSEPLDRSVLPELYQRGQINVRDLQKGFRDAQGIYHPWYMPEKLTGLAGFFTEAMQPTHAATINGKQYPLYGQETTVGYVGYHPPEDANSLPPAGNIILDSANVYRLCKLYNASKISTKIMNMYSMNFDNNQFIRTNNLAFGTAPMLLYKQYSNTGLSLGVPCVHWTNCLYGTNGYLEHQVASGKFATSKERATGKAAKTIHVTMQSSRNALIARPDTHRGAFVNPVDIRNAAEAEGDKVRATGVHIGKWNEKTNCAIAVDLCLNEYHLRQFIESSDKSKIPLDLLIVAHRKTCYDLVRYGILTNDKRMSSGHSHPTFKPNGELIPAGMVTGPYTLGVHEMPVYSIGQRKPKAKSAASMADLTAVKAEQTEQQQPETSGRASIMPGGAPGLERLPTGRSQSQLPGIQRVSAPRQPAPDRQAQPVNTAQNMTASHLGSSPLQRLTSASSQVINTPGPSQQRMPSSQRQQSASLQATPAHVGQKRPAESPLSSASKRPTPAPPAAGNVAPEMAERLTAVALKASHGTEDLNYEIDQAIEADDLVYADQLRDLKKHRQAGVWPMAPPPPSSTRQAALKEAYRAGDDEKINALKKVSDAEYNEWQTTRMLGRSFPDWMIHDRHYNDNIKNTDEEVNYLRNVVTGLHVVLQERGNQAKVHAGQFQYVSQLLSDLRTIMPDVRKEMKRMNEKVQIMHGSLEGIADFFGELTGESERAAGGEQEIKEEEQEDYWARHV